MSHEINEYQIVEKMATGGFGTVFKVRRILDDGIFVMKRIPLGDFDDDQRHEATQEIRVMSRLHHPFIVVQRDAFLFNRDDLCIVMDYYDGGDLDAIIAQQRERDEYLPFEQAMMWFANMCLALQYLHSEGIVHRDLKTHNIFLNLKTREVAIGDFGVAEFVDPAGSPRSPPASQQIFARRRDSELFGPNGSETHETGGGPFGGAVRGTPLYMAPEALESGRCSPASDVWSLGCILYELLSLRHPFESRDIATLVMRVTRGVREPLPPHYPPEVSALVRAMLDLDAAKRPHCAAILQLPAVRVFAQRVAARRVGGRPQSPVERTWAAQRARLALHAPPDGSPNARTCAAPSMPPSRERAAAERAAERQRLASPHSETAQSPTLEHSDANVCASGVAGPLRLPRPVETCSGDAGNVDDMRHKPLHAIRAEVQQYRRLVQSEMRAQERRRHAATNAERFGWNQSPPPRPAPSGGRLGAALAQRRKQRVAEATQRLGPPVFAQVYAYYKSVDLAKRDAAWVMQIVPNRTRWVALPLVEEVVVIDRLLERVIGHGEGGGGD